MLHLLSDICLVFHCMSNLQFDSFIDEHLRGFQFPIFSSNTANTIIFWKAFLRWVETFWSMLTLNEIIDLLFRSLCWSSHSETSPFLLVPLPWPASLSFTCCSAWCGWISCLLVSELLTVASTLLSLFFSLSLWWGRGRRTFVFAFFKKFVTLLLKFCKLVTKVIH